MDGSFAAGWYAHPKLGLVRVFQNRGDWVYVCYSSSGHRALSKPKTIDGWTWALCIPREAPPEAEFG